MTIASLFCSLSEHGDIAKRTVNEALVTNIEALSTVCKLVTCSSAQSFRKRKFTENAIIVGRSEAATLCPFLLGRGCFKTAVAVKRIMHL